MKFYALAIFFGLFTQLNAHASFFSTVCSNSDSSIRWESGHNSNTIQLQYFNGEVQQVTMPLHHIRINFLKELTLEESEIHRCGFYSKTRTYAGTVIISESPEHPGAISEVLNKEKIETAVICNYHLNGKAPCPVQQ